MSEYAFRHPYVIGFTFLVLIAIAGEAAAESAARVDFAVGDVQAVSAAGSVRSVRKGVFLEQGETINTNKGRAQLRFTDGAFVSLQPGSEFRIDEYRFSGKADGQEKGFFSLLKGGLRTITGLIGKSDKRRYQVTTTVATIGIRGTEYTIQYGNSITGTVGNGEITVCNGAGCLDVTNGESYYVQNQDVKPQISAKGTDLPPAPPENPPSTFAQGEVVDAGGNPLPGFVLTGSYDSTNLNGAYVFNNEGIGTGNPTSAEFDANGGLLKLDKFAPAAPVTNGGNDGYVAWGYFVNDISGFKETVAYVVGTPTPMADLGDLKSAGAVGTYNLSGRTPVIDGSGATIGTLNGASLKADFVSGRLQASMDWSISGRTVLGTLTGSVSSSPQFTLQGTCSQGCTFLDAQGSFFGPKALRAGFAYIGDGNDWGGAAVFTQTGTQ